MGALIARLISRALSILGALFPLIQLDTVFSDTPTLLANSANVMPRLLISALRLGYFATSLVTSLYLLR